jgi:hypothetical protein
MWWDYKEPEFKYLKSGDESGHLCSRCDVPMVFEKGYLLDYNGKKIFKNGKAEKEWFILCRCCGKKLGDNTHHLKSAYV